MPGMAVRRQQAIRAPSGCRELAVLCRSQACTSPYAVVAGAGRTGRPALTMDEVEAYLTSDRDDGDQDDEQAA